MTHSDVIIGHVVTLSVKLYQEAPMFRHILYKLTFLKRRFILAILQDMI